MKDTRNSGMNRRVKFLAAAVMVFNINVISADIINTESFKNNSVSNVYIKAPASVYSSLYAKIMSPDNKYTAINENHERIIITDLDNKIIFKFEWDDEIINLPKSGPLYLLGWSNDGNSLWFFTYRQLEVDYIAKAGIDSKTLTLYDTKMKDWVAEYVIDTENEIFYYGSFSNEYTKSPNRPCALYQYNIKTKEETLIVRRKQINGPFNPRIENGIIQYDKKDGQNGT